MTSTETEAVRTITLDGVEVRTDNYYAIGLVWQGQPDQQCRKGDASYVCTLDAGTPHEYHVAGTSGGYVAHIWRNEDFDPDAPEPTEVDRYKARIRTLVQAIYTSRGYGSVETWNPVMVELGIEPFTKRSVKVIAPATRVVAELGTRFDEAGAREWLDARRSDLASYLRPEEDEIGEPVIEVEESAPNIEGVEALYDANTDDLDTYKELVRERGIELGREQGWCDDGVNGVLDELGLDHIIRERDYVIELEVRATQTVTFHVTARNEEEAANQVDSYLIRERIDRSEWSWDERWDSDDLGIEED